MSSSLYQAMCSRPEDLDVVSPPSERLLQKASGEVDVDLQCVAGCLWNVERMEFSKTKILSKIDCFLFVLRFGRFSLQGDYKSINAKTRIQGNSAELNRRVYDGRIWRASVEYLRPNVLFRLAIVTTRLVMIAQNPRIATP